MTANAFAREAGAGLRLEHVVWAYGDVHALNGISLDVAPGEFFTLLRPSGSGKTITLQLIAGCGSSRLRVAGDAREDTGPECAAAELRAGASATVKGAEAEAPCHGAGLTGGCSLLQAAKMTLRATEPRQIQKMV